MEYLIESVKNLILFFFFRDLQKLFILSLNSWGGGFIIMIISVFFFLLFMTILEHLFGKIITQIFGINRIAYVSLG